MPPDHTEMDTAARDDASARVGGASAGEGRTLVVRTQFAVTDAMRAAHGLGR